MFTVETTGILITPVAKVIKAKKSGSPDSRRDYNEQCERFLRGQIMCWDDDKQNNSQVGDIFGFYKGQECVETLLGTQRVANDQSRVQMIQYINFAFRNGTEV